MSQTFTDDLYEQSYVADTTLVNMENNMAALKSLFSGGAAPSNPVGFMPWGDSTSGHEILKRRNDANDAWLAILCGDANFKMWVYRNDTCEGWVIDSSITDRVLSVKGGSNAYNVNGGNVAGTWTQPGHVLTEAESPAHTHGSAGAHVHGLEVAGAAGGSNESINSDAHQSQNRASESGMIGSSGAHTHNSVGGGSSHAHGDTYRPAAAVGTLQYPDL